jgi:membrane protease subunit HflC
VKRVFVLLVVVGVLVGVIASVTFSVHQNDYVVLTQFGEPVETITVPGLNFRWPPPIQRVNRFDRRLQLHQGLLLECLTKDKKNLAVRCVVLWRVSDPMSFFVSVGTMGAAAQKLDDLLTSRGAGAVGEFEFDDLISIEHIPLISDLEQRILNELSDRLASGGYGIDIETVEVDRLALSPANAASVYERMRKERNAIANKYRAEGDEEAAKIRAQADLEKSEILSAAYKEAQKIKGEGEAEAGKIYSEAFSRDPEFYRFWRTLQSYQKILDEKTTLVLSEDSELLKYLGE